jgi:hypothetical protein
MVSDLKTPRMCVCECGWEIPTAGALETIRKHGAPLFSEEVLLLWSNGFAFPLCARRFEERPHRHELTVINGGKQA